MRWPEVARWLERVGEIGVSSFHQRAMMLSSEGTQEALSVALTALNGEVLSRIARQDAKPYRTVHFIAARTVFTAPLEWVAILLGLGSTVTLKRPQHELGVWEDWVMAANGLPLTLTTERRPNGDPDLVIAMGEDKTVSTLKSELAGRCPLLAFGHRFSISWVTGNTLISDPLVPSRFQSNWDSLAADAALHDGRGCLSPTLVFTPLPLATALPALAEAMHRAEARWPRGKLHDIEGAEIRSRHQLAAVTGQALNGPSFSLHGLPARHCRPIALPRSLAVISVKNRAQAVSIVSPWAAALSTVGTDDPASASEWMALGASRVCRLGRMQRPPVERIHDGVDWIKAIRQGAG